jgi:hypothetical protein
MNDTTAQRRLATIAANLAQRLQPYADADRAGAHVRPKQAIYFLALARTLPTL